MSLQCGLIGLPNVGKSALFNALTSGKAKTDNYPFCTVEPNTGLAFVPDKRLHKIASLFQPQKVQPAALKFTDIAGLVKGASEGQGLGNRFLSHIRETQALLHVLRAFEDPDISHAPGAVDPERDMEIVDTELLLADLEAAEKRLQKSEKLFRVSGGDKEQAVRLPALKKAHAALSEGRALRDVKWEEPELRAIAPLNFISLKPVIYILNVGESEASDEKREAALARFQKALAARGLRAPAAAASAAVESQLARLEEAGEREEFLSLLSIKEPALNRVAKLAFALLNRIVFFTAGESEVRAWPLRKGASASQAAGLIHSDFEKGFIRAEIYSFKDLAAHKSEKTLREKGLIRSEGKSYEMQDGDIAHFRFNV